MSSYTIPTVIERTPKGERVSDIYSRLLSERIVFVGTPIDDGVANVVVAQILHLASESESDISLYINSPGGSFSAALAIYDTMRFVAPDIATLCIGQAASTAAILLAAGTPGKRAALPHARVLLHQPHADLSRGSISDLALEAAELARVREEGEALLAHHLRKAPDEVRRDTDRALALRADDAVAYGVIDDVLTSVEDIRSGSGSQQLRPTGGEPVRP